MNLSKFFARLLLVANLFTLPVFAADQDEIVLRREKDSLGFDKPIPVSISGFTGEVDTTLKNDLLFMGIQNVTPDQAKYLISGNNAGRVEGRLVEKVTKNQIFGKAYAGGSLRGQTHALADDIAQAITGKPGIAQTKVAFKVEPGLGKSEIYIADFDGQNARAVTQDRTRVFAPCWATRSLLVYGSYKLGPPYLYSHDLPTGSRRAIARYPGSNISPAVSPDGLRLAMVLSKNGNPDLYVSNMDGSGLRQLTNTKEEEACPSWSPDGRTIVFVSRSRGPAGLYTIPMGGGEMRRLQTLGAPTPTEPDWSPDGKWIAFTMLTREHQICIVPATGGTAVPLVAGEDPTWAPNSRAIMFCRGPDHSKKLYLLDVPSKQVKDIARILESNSQPSWARQK